MSDDTPTQRIPQDEIGEELVEERKKSRTLMFILIGVGAALLVGLIVLIVILVTPRAGTVPVADTTPPPASATSTPTPSDTPTATPTPTPTVAPSETSAPPPPPPPPDTSPGFASFSAPNVKCPEPVESGEELGAPAIIKFTYKAKNAQSVWFIFGNEDAANQGIFEMPLQGDQSDVYGNDDPIYFPCSGASTTMTLTVVGTNGAHVNKTFVVTNNGYRE
jgi:predicted nucleic acid-binding Zn ribbon protein